MKLLVGVDLSSGTERIVESALAVAQGLAAKVWLLHVGEPEPDFVGLDVGPQYERDALSEKLHKEHREIQDIATRFRDAGLDATALLVQGPTSETILNEVSKLDADMLIVGSHGKGAVHKLLVGSVSEGVLRKAAIPVLVIPTRGDE